MYCMLIQRGDSLTAHQDKSEPNPSAPLVSISIGLDAVFLIGSSSRDVKPLAILLKSGDVLVMAGPARRSFHGIPRVEPCTLSTAWDNCSEDLRKFMTDSRININVRQVN